MKIQFTISWKVYAIVTLAGLSLLLILSQMNGLVLAQSPDSTPPAAPPSETPSPPINPPSVEMLGEAIRDANYVSGDDEVDSEGGMIDIFDLSFVASRYGSNDPAADLNLDGQVNIFDLSLLANGYQQTEPAAAAAPLPTPLPLPRVETGMADFGAFDLAVSTTAPEAEIQAAPGQRPLRIGVGINYIRAYDPMDLQTQTPPDLYSAAGVGGVWARTAVWGNSYEIQPNWRLGWWRYQSFPWAPSSDPVANYYNLPINLEIRDDDGRICYGYYGCRERFELTDISSVLQTRVKQLTLFPASCRIVDEAGVETRGYWLDGAANSRCRVELQSWGSEWPRAYLSYFIDAAWD